MGGAKITLIFKDHEGNPTLGADQAKKLILDDKVDGLLGCYHSSVTKTVSAVAEQYGVPMINGSSTSPALTERGLKWFWRTTPHDTWFTKDLFEFLKGLTEGQSQGCQGRSQERYRQPRLGLRKDRVGLFRFGTDRAVFQRVRVRSEKIAALRQGIPGSLQRGPLPEGLPGRCPAVCLLHLGRHPDDQDPQSPENPTQNHMGAGCRFRDARDFQQTLGEDIVGIMTRRGSTLPQVVKVKPLAGQVNKLYKAKTENDLSGASARSFTGLQTWVYILEKAGSTKPADIQAAANAIEIPGDQLVVPWAGIKFSTSGKEIGQNVLGSGLIGRVSKRIGRKGRIGNRLSLRCRHDRRYLPVSQMVKTVADSPLRLPSLSDRCAGGKRRGSLSSEAAP